MSNFTESFKRGLGKKIAKRTMKSVIDIGIAVYVSVCIPFLFLTLLLLIHAETWRGRCFALAVLLFLPTPILCWLTRYLKPKKRLVFATLPLLLISFCLIVLIYCYTPTGMGELNSGTQSSFRGGSSFSRCSVANLVPEVDQLIVGSHVFTMIDPFIDSEKGNRIRALFLHVYREMRKSSEFRCLGSVMNYTYRDIFMNDRTTGHQYLYIPQGSNGKKLPVILFLHGSLGNFKGYLWTWKKFADMHKFAIVSPTFGAGDWDREGGMEAVGEALAICKENDQLNGKRIFLAGISNGGKGVSRAVCLNPDAYEGLIYISPVLETEELLKPKFISTWKKKPMIVVHGSKDSRIDKLNIETPVRMLKKNGIPVTIKYYEKEDHFLMFSAQDRLFNDISKWLKLQ